MFSGIIQTLGCVRSTQTTQTGRRLMIEPVPGGLGDVVAHMQNKRPITMFEAEPPGLGESICVSGCCLTLVRAMGDDRLLCFDVIPETLALTTIDSLKPGDMVNLERSVTASTLLDGHIVQGHVQGTGCVRKVESPDDDKAEAVGGEEFRLQLEVPVELLPCIVPKGSIAIDGVSLTVAAVDVDRARFEVALIPTTHAHTTLGGLRLGARVNIETDILARTVVHTLEHFRAGGFC